MKKARRIIVVAIIAVVVAVLTIRNSAKAYSINLYSTSTSVESGEQFTVTMNLSEQTPLINVTLEYDKELFSYVGGASGYAENVNEADDGAIEILHGSSSNSPISVVSFNFKANSVSSEKSGIFRINNIAVVTNEGTNLVKSNIDLSTCTVTIKPKSEEPPAPEPPSISPSSLSLTVGQTGTVSSNSAVSWSSSNTGVATVSSDGTVTAVAEGDALIIATDANNLSSSIPVSVKAAGGDIPVIPSDPDAPKITPEGNVTLKIGETVQKYADPSDVIWMSSNDNVATVENGLIRAVGNGTAVITASKDSKSSSFFVTVQENGGGNQGDNPGGSQGGGTQDDNPGGGNQGDNPGGGNQDDNSGGGNQGGSQGGNAGGTTGSQGSGNATGSVTTSQTGNPSSNGTVAAVGSENSSSEEDVPATGESTAETLVILAIVTLIVAAFIFKRKIRIR